MGFSLVGQFFSHGTKMGQKFFLHKNKKTCYYNIDTCSCGLSFPGDCAGLTRRVLVHVRETMRKPQEIGLGGGFVNWFLPPVSKLVFAPTTSE
jgi:hypothetical protein